MTESISSKNNVVLGSNDVVKKDAVKYICEFSNKQIVLNVLDEEGKQVFNTDANGNNKVAKTKVYKFTPVSGHKNADGKVDPRTAFCFFIADPEKLGNDYDRIIKRLERNCKNPLYKMYKEDDHFKKRNPEAFRIASEKAELENAIEREKKANDEKQKEIDSLKNQLFGKKKA